ncbi:hypothetical protein LC653_42310 [Nostoc sp. CHAB 5784]|uniref:hypothetical protein n=1 Tax=Nostoc mirabile TaxID=2907820 RepID=UPI001E444F71|nr:hypothetical protein [Nostoc mirabile]MCC5670251.1 hypothetical protein [Nostoc mirabile CHAB5784]
MLRRAAVATTGSHCGGRVPRHKASGVGTPLRVRQSPTAGNPPTALDSPQRAALPGGIRVKCAVAPQ